MVFVNRNVLPYTSVRKMTVDINTIRDLLDQNEYSFGTVSGTVTENLIRYGSVSIHFCKLSSALSTERVDPLDPLDSSILLKNKLISNNFPKTSFSTE